MNDSSRRRVRLARRLSWLVVGALTVAALVPGLALADHAIADDTSAPNANNHPVTPDNPKCGVPRDGGYASPEIAAADLGVGTYGPIDITYYDGTYISWAINAAFLDTYDANMVIVKGGPNAVIYQYSLLDDDPTNPAVAGGLPGIPAGGDPAGGPDDADYRLTAPQNLNGEGSKYYGISHVQFCFDPKGSPTPTPYCVTVVKSDLLQARLAGAVFIVKNASGEQVGEPSEPTNENGEMTVCGLFDGYSIWEVTPPPGYLIGTGEGSQVAEVPSTCFANEGEVNTAYTCYFVNAPVTSPTPTPTPTPPPNPTPTPTPPPNPTPTPTPVPTPTPTPVPTPTPTPEPTPTPTGEVAGETGAPAVTLPPTDSLSSGSQGPAGDSWRLIVLAMAGILAATLLLTPTEASRKRR